MLCMPWLLGFDWYGRPMRACVFLLRRCDDVGFLGAHRPRSAFHALQQCPDVLSPPCSSQLKPSLSEPIARGMAGRGRQYGKGDPEWLRANRGALEAEHELFGKASGKGHARWNSAEDAAYAARSHGAGAPMPGSSTGPAMRAPAAGGRSAPYPPPADVPDLDTMSQRVIDQRISMGTKPLHYNVGARTVYIMGRPVQANPKRNSAKKNTKGSPIVPRTPHAQTP